MSEPSIGIDLGTTNSVVATVVDGQAKVIERQEGQRLLASMVGYTPKGERVVGEPARQLALTHPRNVAFATKRLMGQRWSPELAASYRSVFPFALVSGPNDDVRVKIADRAVPVAQIAAALLSELRQDASAYFGCEVTKAVITVPANFNDAQRQATKEAGKIAGLEVMRLVNEPTAAALAYGLHTRFEGRAVVFDLGGGTFDVSVLEMREGVFEVVATGGDPFLGGEDFDEAVVGWLLSQLPPGLMRDWVHADKAAMQQLRLVAEGLKRTLTSASEAPVRCEVSCERAGNPIPLETTLTRDAFEGLVSGLVERCVEIVERTLGEANLSRDAIGQVILVGGMTRVPLIRRRVSERFGIAPMTHLFPDEVVGVGAAIHAAELANRAGNTLLLDITSSTLGVGVAGGLTRPLIPKNKTLPCRAREIFYPTNDGQTVVRIPVVQGGAAYVEQNYLLGEVVLDGLQRQRRGENAIEVVFDMDLDGSLAVTALDVTSGRSASVHVRARTDLRPQEIDRLRREEAERQAAQRSAPESRQHNAEIRNLFRARLVAFRRLHSELVLAARESRLEQAQLVVDVLGQRLVDAERLEQTGAVAEVEAMTRNLEELIASLEGVQPPDASAAG